MKIKNTGKKIVFIGNITLMPGDEITVANTIAQTPAVKVLAEHGALQLTEETAHETTKPEISKTTETVKAAIPDETQNFTASSKKPISKKSLIKAE